jgi:hypothetical protein
MKEIPITSSSFQDHFARCQCLPQTALGRKSGEVLMFYVVAINHI